METTNLKKFICPQVRESSNHKTAKSEDPCDSFKMSLLTQIVCYLFLLSHLSICFLIYRTNNIDSIVSKIQPQNKIPFPLLQLAKNVTLHKSKEKNFVFSPVSLQLALSLLATGSTGSTLKEFLTFLQAKHLNHLTSVAKQLIGILAREPKISVVSSIWVDKTMPLKPIFRSRAKSIYKANATSVDFQNNQEMVIKEINNWAAEGTNGLIQSVLPLPPYSGPLLTVVLANAIYLKAKWITKFQKQDTEVFPFYLADGTRSVSARFMSSSKDQYISIFDNFKVLRLPYENAPLCMYIILPNQVNGIWSLVEKIGSDQTFFETYLRPCEEVEVGKFRIPKFRMEYEFEASEYLKNIGLNMAFSGEAKFDDMVEGGGLRVDKVYHKAYIEIDEEGTEAAVAVAAELLVTSSGRFDEVDFVADHPFMFVVRDDKSGIILFIGHVMNPSS